MCESCCVLVLPSSLKLIIIRVGVKKASERKSWCRAFKSLCLSEKILSKRRKAAMLKSCQTDVRFFHAVFALL